MRTALYGGTFDPIHNGHLILAREALEQLGLDRVVLIPAGVSPHKLAAPPVSAALRLAMVQAAIANEPGFLCDDGEVYKSGPSYTIETVRRWREAHPSDQMFYLIGHDNVQELHTWREIDSLRKLTQFVVFDRGNREASHEFPRICRNVDISASEIRKRVAAGRSIRYLVPEPVLEIIRNNRLYQGDSSLTQNS